MSELEEFIYDLDWNNSMSIAAITIISYEYILQFEKEVTFVWAREWSVMKYLYLAVRYFGILVAIISALWGGLFYMPEAPYVGIVSYATFLFIQWGTSLYSCLTKVILIWRLYALYNQSKALLYVLLGFFIPIVALYIAMDVFLWSRPSAVSMQEIIISPKIKYCVPSYHIGPMAAVYTSIPAICYDILLVVLAIAVLVNHIKERKELEMKPNAYVVLIVRYHVIYFVLNLTIQIFTAILWADLPTVVMNFILLFYDTAPYIIVPRFIMNIWETHANDNCVHVSTTFEDCVCWTSPPQLEQHEMDRGV
ncbi:uncharacterized protein EDB93DRAFT_1301950 [Suillus bovinus]|uniref:uncharacterized protein n=1 Tax=Suillus bovinus TaxID=48563 RepID=UPI001B878619|nr:uncharacterized protein EDB93DRAFT_1301950 [Suillus bovinus]KAG2137572.1 hypothetical protein EDB93DRAFT_1301950 [Suillus bovinus]